MQKDASKKAWVRAAQLLDVHRGTNKAEGPDGDTLMASSAEYLKAAADHYQKASELREAARDAHRSAEAHTGIAAVLIAGVLDRANNGPDALDTDTNPPGENAPAGAAPLVNSVRLMVNTELLKRARKRALRTLSAVLASGEKITIN